MAKSQAGIKNPAYKHGHSSGTFSPEYHSWVSMKVRCYNKNRRSYKHYGAKGVTVCDRWVHSFENFYKDMGARPEGKTLDRIDVYGNYEPSNCRWADSVTQARNSRQTVSVRLNGVTKYLVEWCEYLNISINTVRCRVNKHGWSYEKALTEPIQDRHLAVQHMNAVRSPKK